jgi:hypothetical protein
MAEITYDDDESGYENSKPTDTKDDQDTGFDSHDWCLRQLQSAQDADNDNREAVREAHHFVSKRDGQWEDSVASAFVDRPRYTIDLTSPFIDQVAGDIERMDFGSRVSPAGGQASKENAEAYEGLIRNIENQSKAQPQYNRAMRSVVKGGFDALRVIQQYVDGDSFDQDLLVKRIPNAVDRVWWGPHEEPDASDADYCWVLNGMTEEEFEARFPDQPVASVSSDRETSAYYNRVDLIMVGEFFCLKPVTRTLVKMSNGAVFVEDDAFLATLPELAATGIEPIAKRNRLLKVAYSRLFSEHGWLTEPRETVFHNWLPVIPMYANFEVYEDKVLYHGVVEKLMDPQRVLNYAMSREIEEGALAPRAKYWMTEVQKAGHEAELATLNTSADPIATYNNDPDVPGPPQQSGGAQVNPGLRNITTAMQQILGEVAGKFAATMGENPGLQSGKAIEALQDRGAVGDNKYLLVRELVQAHIGRILVNTIPRVYDPGRQVRLLHEDGTQDMITIGETVQGADGQQHTLYDLTIGTYDVVCESGPSFKSRQSQTVRAVTEIGAVDPTVIQMGGDILLANIAAPGMDQLAARKREQLFKAGAIPMSQLTDEEQAQLQEMQQQPQQEDPNMVLAKAEELKAQAEQASVQLKQQVAQADAMHKQQTMQLEGARFQFETDIKNQQMQLDTMKAQNDRLALQIELAKAQATIAKDQAAASKTLAEAEAQDMDNDSVASGLQDLLTRLQQGG